MRKRLDELRSDGSRRRFLQTVGLAAAGATSIGAAQGVGVDASPSSRPIGPEDVAGCDCEAEAALPVVAAAALGSSRFGLAASATGPRLHLLDVGAGDRVSLGSLVDLDLPKGFVASSLGVFGGRMVLTGGRPFVWTAFDADDEADPLVLESMSDFPEDLPKTGRRRIPVMGMIPAMFSVDPPEVTPVVLPELPRRLFAVSTEVAEGDAGTLMVMIEHSDELTESWYAEAVDVLERRGNEWTSRSAGRKLGESGPNRLAAIGDDAVVALKTSKGVTFIRPRTSAKVEWSAQGGRVLGVVRGAEGLHVLTADGGGVRMWGADGGRWADRGTLRLEGDEVVSVVRVAGTLGQTLLLGRRSARLVDESAARVAPKGGR